MKVAEGQEDKWPSVVHQVFWAERVTTQKATHRSPYYMAHGVEPLLPFDLAEGTFMTEALDAPLSTTELIATRARALLRRPADLQLVHERVLKARLTSAAAFSAKYENTITEQVFDTGALVMVRNSRVHADLNRKTKPRYLGPMVVVRRTQGGSYILSELDGSVSALRYAAFRLVPYYPRSHISIPVTQLVSYTDEHLDMMAASEDDPFGEDTEETWYPHFEEDGDPGD